MPRIPILQKPGLLGDAPRPVLDTQRRPTVDRSGEMRALQGVADASKMPKVDAAAMTAPMRALGAVGEAVQRTGGIMSALALKQAEAETTIQVAKADQMMQEGFNKHLEFRDKNPDPRTWEKDLQEKLAESRKAIDGTKGLRMAAKEQIDLRYAMFSGKSLADTKTAGAKETFNQAKSVLDGQIMDAMRDEKWDESVDLTQQKVDAGYGYPHEVAAQKTRVKEMKEYADKKAYASKMEKAQEVVYNDPDAAEEHFEILSEGLKADEKNRLKYEIDRTKQEQRSNEIDDLANALARDEYKSEAALEAAFPKKMEDATREKFRDSWRNRQIPGLKQKMQEDAPANYARFVEMVDLYDPDQDKDKQQYPELQLTIGNGLPTELANELQAELRKKAPGHIRELEPPEPLKQTVRNITRTMFEAGAFGKYKTLVPQTGVYGDPLKPKIVVDPNAKAAAQGKQGSAMLYMTKWAAANPDADPGKVFEVLREFLAGNAPAIRSTAPPTPEARARKGQKEMAPWEEDLPDTPGAPSSDLIPFFLPPQ